MENRRPSEIFRGAFRAVGESYPALLIYWGITVPVSAAILAGSVLLDGFETPNEPNGLAVIWAILLDIAHPALVALAASVAFSRLGRELDKPLWKVEGAGEAIKRFFLPWFILFLGFVAFDRAVWAVALRSEEPALMAASLLAVGAFAALIIPVGACIMFAGRLVWTQLLENLAPLLRQFPATAIFLGFGFLASLTLTLLAVEMRASFAPLALSVELLDGYCECVVFAGIWEICRIDRDTAGPEPLEL